MNYSSDDDSHTESSNWCLYCEINSQLSVWSTKKLKCIRQRTE